MGPAFSGGFDGIASGIFISRVIHQMDVRVIAATHRDLKTEAAAGRFREDLFYRLHVFPVRMPARRERREDIPLLAAHFLEKHSRAFRRELKGFTPEALRTMTGYGWPGNVRELENAVERAVAVAGGTNVDGRDLPADLRGGAPAGNHDQVRSGGLVGSDGIERTRRRPGETRALMTVLGPVEVERTVYCARKTA